MGLGQTWLASEGWRLATGGSLPGLVVTSSDGLFLVRTGCDSDGFLTLATKNPSEDGTTNLGELDPFTC